MSAPLPERLVVAMAQKLLDEEQRRAGQPPIPIGCTTFHGDLYALASALMDAISPLMAEDEAYRWPDLKPCPHMLGALCCQRSAHDDAGHVFHSAYVADQHDRTEGVQG